MKQTADSAEAHAAENHSPEPLLEAIDIYKTYEDGSTKVEVLKGVDLAIEAGGIVAIIGPSGVGKSTLLHILGLLDRPTSGRLLYQGKDVSTLKERQRAALRASDWGFIFQMFHLLPDLNAQENTMLPALVGSGLFGRAMPRSQAVKRSKEILNRVGLGERLLHRPNQLSGGEKQRVGIARALMNSPQLVFCDEPTGNLDPKTSEEIFQLILDYNREYRQTFVLITHEHHLAAQADAVYRMDDGRLMPAELNHSHRSGRGAPAPQGDTKD
jgi:ABC-type lipoprotein export system ATPase subunit